jgi:hypothetical protein
MLTKLSVDPSRNLTSVCSFASCVLKIRCIVQYWSWIGIGVQVAAGIPKDGDGIGFGPLKEWTAVFS